MSGYKKHIQKNLRAILSIVLILTMLIGCDLLQVNNPNSLVKNDLENPAAAPALANGAEATVTDALGTVLGPYSTASDELTWVGTLDAWQQLDLGEVSDPQNQFTDEAFQQVAEARFTADKAIDRLQSFKEEGKLKEPLHLVRSYFYGAVVYTYIADMFDDFVLSERGEAAPPVGGSNIKTFYDTALNYVDKGLSLAQQVGTSKWRSRLLALRARVHYSKGLWEKLNPDVNTSNPLVESPEAVDAAKKALDRIGQDSDWEYQLVVNSNTEDNDFAYSVNQRLELRISNEYITPTSDNKVKNVVLSDPIDSVTAPHLTETIHEFSSEEQYADITVLTNRELHLIIAEDALASGDKQTFRKHINKIRALDDLTEYKDQVPARDLLQHERRVNLFLQGRRLADQYRFQVDSPNWVKSRVERGSFFPITITEIRSNPNIGLDE